MNQAPHILKPPPPKHPKHNIKPTRNKKNKHFGEISLIINQAARAIQRLYRGHFSKNKLKTTTTISSEYHNRS